MDEKNIEVLKRVALPRQRNVFALIRAAGWHLSGHTLTFFSAFHARLGAFLAMIHLVLRAFLSAGPADLGTKSTELISVFTFAAHQGGSQGTKVRAVAVKLDASSHHFHIVLAQASRCTRFAYQGTVRTSLDARSEH
tara:strand:- start:32 stop:442 length:411 start_codon:yes stop_codon:yes gene_type:complete